MPRIKSAKKKMRQDIKRTKRNDGYRKSIEKIIKIAKKATGKTKETLKKAFSTIDKAAKKKIIHKNKAARLKAQVSKLINQKKTKK